MLIVNALEKNRVNPKYLLFAKKIAWSDIKNAIGQISFCCALLDFTFDTASTI
jgi:hypothetical protein